MQAFRLVSMFSKERQNSEKIMKKKMVKLKSIHRFTMENEKFNEL